MKRPNENPLLPACLAADGKQGEDAKALRPCESQDSVEAMRAHYQARKAVGAAREHLDALALATDDPKPGMVEAADLLDLAALQLADFAPSIKDSDGGEV